MADTDDPIATVQRMFAAFGADDLDAVLETGQPDSRWTTVLWLGVHVLVWLNQTSGRNRVETKRRCWLCKNLRHTIVSRTGFVYWGGRSVRSVR